MHVKTRVGRREITANFHIPNIGDRLRHGMEFTVPSRPNSGGPCTRQGPKTGPGINLENRRIDDDRGIDDEKRLDDGT